MRTNNAETITGEVRVEQMGDAKRNADIVVEQIQEEAIEIKEEAAELSLELDKAMIAKQEGDAAQRQANETGERIAELAA